jgi:CRISPR/Cas system-associated exonuclease Cas4 (RecB family)
MTLVPDLQFSQASLQDYVDCPRRFQLRYVERVDWPAPEAEPALDNERYLRQGAAFHRLIHQYLLGLPPERLSSATADDDLSHWWRNYLESGPADLPSAHHPEALLSAPVAGHRLVAKYDLIAVDPGRRVVIVDWKTTRKRPRRAWLAQRLQTRIYPYLLVRAGVHLNGGQPVAPEQVEMMYWFASFPKDPERFVYDTAQHHADEVYLKALIEEINDLADEEWPLTSQKRHCEYCPYRSLCQRGIRAGPFEDMEGTPEPDDDWDVLTDFEQIAEIEY